MSLMATLSLCVLGALECSDPAHTLFYTRPAAIWEEALPVGNGRLGAMIYGGVAEEQIQFNEDTLWTGSPRSYARQGAADYLPKIRELLFEGKQKEAEDCAMKYFMSDPVRQKAYQAFGDLFLRMDHEAAAQDYHRELDLRTALSRVRYTIEGVGYEREYFASFPHQAILCRLCADQPGQISTTIRLEGAHKGCRFSHPAPNQVAMAGGVEDGAIRFEARLLVQATGGEVRPTQGGFQIAGADEVVLVLAGATNYINWREVSGDPGAANATTLRKLAGAPYTALREAHLEDYQPLYDRVRLSLGAGNQAIRGLDTDDRVLQFRRNKDLNLVALLFHYGRYLLIASSREGGQPANLQGIWNASNAPSWDSKWTVNINTEMNYWPAEPTRLPECVPPLIAMLEEVAESGAEVAQAHYGARGWVLHHNTDLWRGAAPINHANHGIWPTGGAWLCQQVWHRYLYGGDAAWLRETGYPLMKGAALFFVDTLVEDPARGWLISGPSNSPELGGLVMGPTMDHQIIRELFANVIEAARILDVDAALREELAALRSRIAPNQIGQHGQLQEWLEDKDNPKEKHRHVSHLWGLFPGSEITPETPDLFAAAEQSLRFRGDGGTGWSMAWKVNFWARLLDGDHAYLMLKNLLRLTGSTKTSMKGGGVYPNLFDAHPPFQIDGNFGAVSGIVEMLLQSHRGGIDLLPALPKAWATGAVEGLKARGGVVVDLEWKAQQLTKARLVAPKAMPQAIRYQGKRITLELSPAPVVLGLDADGGLARR